MTVCLTRAAVAGLALVAIAFGSGAQAQTTINQNKAEAGGIVASDLPGFPITIDRPGSYRLTGNLTVPTATHGIVVTASDVTIDLNGFTIAGPITCTTTACTPSSGGGIGVLQNSPYTGIVVRNGTVRGFQRGVFVNARAHIENLTATQHIDWGVSVQDGSLVQNVRASLVRLDGIYALRSTVLNSIADWNGGAGFSLIGSQLRFSQATQNGGAAIRATTGGAFGRAVYAQNLFQNNSGGAVLGLNATSLGGNFCDGVSC
jgi:hypothetical protein